MTSTVRKGGIGLILGLSVVGFGLTLHPVVGRANGVITAVVLATMLAAGTAFWSWMRAQGQGRIPRVVWQPRAAHGFQALAHLCVYVYWATHHHPTQEQLWLIAAQVPFAYLIDMAAAWRKHDEYRLGFGPLPIVGSINLFLWLTDEWFLIQFATIVLYGLESFYGERMVIRTVTSSIHPPLLCCCCAVLLVSNSTEFTARDCLISRERPFCYESVLIGGLIVQFSRGLTTLGAFVALVGLSSLSGDNRWGVFYRYNSAHRSLPGHAPAHY